MFSMPSHESGTRYLRSLVHLKDPRNYPTSGRLREASRNFSRPFLGRADATLWRRAFWAAGFQSPFHAHTTHTHTPAWTRLGSRCAVLMDCAISMAARLVTPTQGRRQSLKHAFQKVWRDQIPRQLADMPVLTFSISVPFTTAIAVKTLI